MARYALDIDLVVEFSAKDDRDAQLAREHVKDLLLKAFGPDRPVKITSLIDYTAIPVAEIDVSLRERAA